MKKGSPWILIASSTESCAARGGGQVVSRGVKGDGLEPLFALVHSPVTGRRCQPERRPEHTG
jgi:hypothetical protein